MRTREFMNKQKRTRGLLPRDPKTIELHKAQYELLKKRAEAVIKMKQAKNEDEEVVSKMADSAVYKRMNTGKLA